MGKTAFLCSGQGAQRVGMGVDFARAYAACASVFETAARVSGIDVLALCENGPAEQLSQTQNTQPALVATSLAIATELQEHGVQPDCVAGFSLGEYAAHAIARTVDAETALMLVSRRGAMMAAAAERVPGGMTALLRCSREQAEQLCAECAEVTRQVLVVANVNCPGQVVISGQNEALQRAGEVWKAAGGKAAPVKTSGAFHSPLMQFAADRMRPALQMTGFEAPCIDLYCNCTARPLQAGQAAETLERQITSPVLWEQTIRAMIEAGVTRFLECGPGKVLTGMVKRTARDMKADVTFSCIESVEDLEALHG